jgi:hypothetical protein
MHCKQCDREFHPAKPWQKFHSAECRDAWHYRQKVQQEREEQIEAARDEMEDRLNGLSAEAPKLDLAELGIAPPEPMKRVMRRLA